jgi:predicted RNA-binding protein YlqC (UPF0109 family)
LAELLEFLARKLVANPGEVHVETSEEDGMLILHLRVAEEDVGQVIGRQGRIARALRTIVRAGGAHEGRRMMLEIAG